MPFALQFASPHPQDQPHHAAFNIVASLAPGRLRRALRIIDRPNFNGHADRGRQFHAVHVDDQVASREIHFIETLRQMVAEIDVAFQQ